MGGWINYNCILSLVTFVASERLLLHDLTRKRTFSRVVLMHTPFVTATRHITTNRVRLRVDQTTCSGGDVDCSVADDGVVGTDHDHQRRVYEWSI